MLRLYFAAGSCAMAPCFALAYAGVEYELVRLNLATGEQLGPTHLSLNPLGRVPVLVDDDFVVTENLAILRYIARRFPHAGLWPETPKDEARCLELMALCATALHPAMAHLRKPQRYARQAESQRDIVDVARTTIDTLSRLVEHRLSDWESARRAAGFASVTPHAAYPFTVADFYLAFFWLFRPGGAYALPDSTAAIENDPWPAWTALAVRVYALPAIRAICEAEGLL